MALTSLGAQVILPNLHLVIATTVVLDATGEKYAPVFLAPASGDITALEIATGTVTSAKAIRVGLQALDASGDPDGTWLGAAAGGYGTIAVPAANTIYQVALGAAVPGVIGTSYAVVVAWDNDADPGNLQISVPAATAPLISSGGMNGQYVDSYLTGAWVKSSGMPGIGVIYGTTRYPAQFLPALRPTYIDLRTTATPDEMGNRFRLPFGARAVGAWCYVSADADTELVLYSDAGGVLATATILTKDRASAGAGYGYAYFVSAGSAAPYTLVADTWYRIVIKPTTTTNCGTRYVTAYEAASLGQLSLGTNCYRCYRTDAGAFTDVTNERATVSIVIDQIDLGSAGGRPEFRGGNL